MPAPPKFPYEDPSWRARDDVRRGTGYYQQAGLLLSIFDDKYLAKRVFPPRESNNTSAESITREHMRFHMGDKILLTYLNPDPEKSS